MATQQISLIAFWQRWCQVPKLLTSWDWIRFVSATLGVAMPQKGSARVLVERCLYI